MPLYSGRVLLPPVGMCFRRPELPSEKGWLAIGMPCPRVNREYELRARPALQEQHLKLCTE